MPHDHGHEHAPGSGLAHGRDHGRSAGGRLLAVSALNVLITVAELLGGLLSGSLALLSDALHNLSDTAALLISYGAARIARRPKNAGRTYGYRRAEILAAFVNAAVLLGICVFLVVEAVRRFAAPQPVDSGLMLAVAAIGLAANLASVLLLRRDAHASLNVRAGFLHLLGDAVSSVGVIAGGLLIRFLGATWIDPLATVLISLYIARESYLILRRTVDILMQGAAPLDYEAIRRDVEGMARVRNLHHVHTWLADERTVHFEAHVDMDDMSLCEAQEVCAAIERLLEEKYGVSHVTLQPEVDSCPTKEMF